MTGEGSVTVRKGVRAAICSAGMVAVFACGPDWTVLNQHGSGFVVAMPNAATCGALRRDTSMGQFVGRSCAAELGRSFIVRPSPALFDVSWSVPPAGLDFKEIVPVLRELATLGLPRGSNTTERSATLGGVQGLEYETVVPVGTGSHDQLTARVRYAIHQGHLYRVGVRGSLGGTSELAWRRMLESFRFVTEGGT